MLNGWAKSKNVLKETLKGWKQKFKRKSENVKGLNKIINKIIKR